MWHKILFNLMCFFIDSAPNFLMDLNCRRGCSFGAGFYNNGGCNGWISLSPRITFLNSRRLTET